jgi:hypothetical protein
MVYSYLVKTQRWILINDVQNGSYYRMRLGRTCPGGCTVPEMSKQEEKEINDWFAEKGIGRSTNVLNSSSWNVEKFKYWYRPASDDAKRLWFHGGYEFRVSTNVEGRIKTKR